MKPNSVTANALWLIAGKLVRSGLSLAVGILTARYLGPEDYGLIHYAAGFTGFFAAFCTLGLPSVLVRELTERPEEEGSILGTALTLQSISSLCSAAVILALVYGLDEGDPTVLTVVGFSCAAMVLKSLEVFQECFQARRQSRITATVLVLSHSATMLCKVLFLILGKPVAWFAFGTAVEQLLAGGFLLGAYGRSKGPKLTISREMAGRLLAKSRYFILPGLMVAVYAQTDRIMLAQLLGEAETGYYSAAVTLCNGWCFVLAAIIDAAYPEIVTAFQQNEMLFNRKNRQLYSLIFYLSGAVSLMTCLLARPLVQILYGPHFLPAAAPLQIITWYTAFSYLGTARNAWIICRDRQKSLIWVYAAAAAANVGLNFVLIPRWGACGAAAASLMAQVVSSVVAPCFLKDLQENSKLMLDAILLCNKEEPR